MDCVICGGWFSSGSDTKICPACERAAKRLNMSPSRACEIVQADTEGRLMILPPNPPLTLEELREMDGEPVWIERSDGGTSIRAIVGDMKSMYGVYFGTAVGGLRLHYDEYGKTWWAYRRKPEEGET